MTIEPYKPSGTDVMTELLIDAANAGKRVDQVIATMLDGWSRSALQRCFQNGDVTHNGRVMQQRDRVYGGETIVISLPKIEPAQDWRAEPVPLDVVYEDEHITVVNKPAGLVVHPGAGNNAGTLANGLLYRDADLAGLARAGVVHRLDKETSGLLVCARTETARLNLIEQLQRRTLHRQYRCVVHGIPPSSGVIDEPIGRSRHDRTRMAVTTSGKQAITEYSVQKEFRYHARLRVRLQTGRTHQIRVHMTWLGYPLIGDPQYGGRRRLPIKAGETLIEAVSGFTRQALHAEQLGFDHPQSGEPVLFKAPLPNDMAALEGALQDDVDAQVHDPDEYYPV